MPSPPRAPRGAFWFVLLACSWGACATPTAWGQQAARPKSAAKAGASRPEKAEREPAKENEKGDADATDEDKPKEEEARPGFLGDTKRFTRLGGWGSIGGTMGQMGMARSALVMMPPVQAELKLTEKQKVKIREWLDGMRQRGEEMGRAMREQQAEIGQQADVPFAARIFQFTQMMNQVGEMLRENEQGLSRILDAPQRKRLTQIALQMEGIAAVTKPEVARAINLGPGQLELIQQYLAQSRIMQMTTWVERGAAMSQRFRTTANNGGPPDDREPRPSPDRERDPKRKAARTEARTEERPGEQARARTDEKPEKEAEGRAEARPGERTEGRPASDRDERARAMREGFESMRDQTDRLQEATVVRIFKVLTRRQRATFEKLLGEPFDPSKLNAMGRPPGDRPAPDAEAETEKAAPRPR